MFRGSSSSPPRRHDGGDEALTPLLLDTAVGRMDEETKSQHELRTGGLRSPRAVEVINIDIDTEDKAVPWWSYFWVRQSLPFVRKQTFEILAGDSAASDC